MKAKLLSALLLICVILTVYATSENKIVLYPQHGSQTEYATSDIMDVTFSGDLMIITLNDGKINEFVIDDIKEVCGIISGVANDTISPDIPTDSVYQGVAIDLGLSIKWASMNIGANNPGDYGEYYAWGESETKSEYDSTNSLWIYTPNEGLLTKGVINNHNNLTPTYDVASVKWGPEWRMPTNDEFEELVKKCNWTWASENGNNGYKVTGPNGNSIFLPAAGWHTSYGFRGANSEGYYWSSTACPYGGVSWGDARCLDFSEKNNMCTEHGRDDGMSIRPVTSYSD